MDVIKKLEEKAKIANLRVTRIKKLQSMLTEDSIDSVAHRQSKIKLNQLLNKFDEVSSDGYGSILVKLDGTYDMFGCSSLSSRLYSENYIVSQLKILKFKCEIFEDCYDARVYLVTWVDFLLRYHEIVKMNIE